MGQTTIAERQWLITVAGIPGTFQTRTGGAISVEHTKEHDGGSLVASVSQGPPVVSDLTVGRAFVVPRDQIIAKDLRKRLASGRRFETTVNATPLDEAMIPVGDAEVYEGVLQSVNAPEGNANSAQTSRLELVFTVKQAR